MEPQIELLIEISSQLPNKPDFLPHGSTPIPPNESTPSFRLVHPFSRSRLECSLSLSLPTQSRNLALYHNKIKVSCADLADHSLLRGQWSTEVSAFAAGHCRLEYWNSADDTRCYSYSATTACANALILPDLSPIASPSESLIDTIEPHALSAKARSNPEDSPTWSEPMSGENAANYYNVAIEELITLQEKLHCWELLCFESTMNVLPSTWAFKCKCYPDGRIKKFKASAHGDHQKEGIDYFETWSPVVQWQTIRLMMIFSSILGLKSAQSDITAATSASLKGLTTPI
jgi:hypothetical protein